MTTSSDAQPFGGTWEEVLITQTLAQFRSGERDYVAGENGGNVHYWKRLT